MALKAKALKVRITNNRLLFITGFIGVIASVLLENSILWVISLVMALTGLFNAGTWSSEKGWGQLLPHQRSTRILALVVDLVMLLAAAGLHVWILSLK